MADRFFIVGGQRCGTTLLYGLFDQHPEIEMAKPLRPEPKFFLDDAKFARGLGAYEAGYFTDPSAPVKGEKSTSYIESDVAADRVAEAYPDARIVVMVRNPIERAVSNYWFSAGNGLETLPMDQAFRTEDARREDYDRSRFSASPYAYLARGDYLDGIRRWEARFPAGRVRVAVFERLVADPDGIGTLYGFVGADPAFRPDVPDGAVNAAPRGPEGPDPALLAFLAAHFAAPVDALSDHLGDPLPEWRSGPSAIQPRA